MLSPVSIVAVLSRRVRQDLGLSLTATLPHAELLRLCLENNVLVDAVNLKGSRILLACGFRYTASMIPNVDSSDEYMYTDPTHRLVMI